MINRSGIGYVEPFHKYKKINKINIIIPIFDELNNKGTMNENINNIEPMKPNFEMFFIKPSLYIFLLSLLYGGISIVGFLKVCTALSKEIALLELVIICFGSIISSEKVITLVSN